MISDDTYRVVKENAALLDSSIIYDRDFHYQYFGFKTLERSYLLRINGRVAERPQHMLMRVAVGIHGDDIERAIQTYNLMSERYAEPLLVVAAPGADARAHLGISRTPARRYSTPARRARRCRAASSSR